MLNIDRWGLPQDVTPAALQAAKTYVEDVLVEAERVGYDYTHSIATDGAQPCTECKCPIPVGHYVLYPHAIAELDLPLDDPGNYVSDVCFECFVESGNIAASPPSDLVLEFSDKGREEKA